MKQTLTLCLMIFSLSLTLNAYDRYHNPNTSGKGNCAQCHSSFTSGLSGKLHMLHTGGPDAITSNCSLCHTSSGFDNPLTMWSSQSGGTGKGCTGCHGRDYGETVSTNIGGFPTAGKPKASAYGLVKHHFNRGETVCLSCHQNANPSFIKPEYVNPPYYSRNDVKLGGSPVFAADHEDTKNDSDSRGLDNDGDLKYDADDPDCSLTVDTHIIPESTGGVVNLAINGGSANASRFYLILGSVTGTNIGIPLPGGQATLPLNWDIFTNLMIGVINTPLLQAFYGQLNANGESTAVLTMTPMTGIAGISMYFAYGIENPWDFASNPTQIIIVP